MALVFPRSWKLRMLRLGNNPGLGLEELLWHAPDSVWHAVQRACNEFSVPVSVKLELLPLGGQLLEDKVCFVPGNPRIYHGDLHSGFPGREYQSHQHSLEQGYVKHGG